MKPNRLPQYWIVQQCDDPRWHKVIDYMNTISNLWTGNDAKCWYGYDGHSSQNGTSSSRNYLHFSNNPVQLTIDQFIEMTEGFVLPELWCIKGCPEFQSWNPDNTNVRGDSFSCYYFPVDTKLKKWDLNRAVPNGWTEITFEQFLTHVVKEPFVLPEHWCIQWKTRNIFDKTCKHFKKGFVFVQDAWISVSGSYSDNKPKDCTEITFQQFKEFVVKEPIPIPEKWCIEVSTQAQRDEVAEWIDANCADTTKAVGHNLLHDAGVIMCSKQWWSVGPSKDNVHYKNEFFITWEQFQTLKTKTMTATPIEPVPKSMNKDQNITRNDLEHIYDIACSTWKIKLEEKAKNTNPFNASVIFTSKEVEEMFNACTAEQLPVVSKFFTRPVTDKNAFIVSSGNERAVENLSQKLFGENNVFQLLEHAVSDSIEHLKNRGFFVDSAYDVATGKTDHGGTWISIFKK